MNRFETLNDLFLAREKSDHRLHFIDGEDEHTSITFRELGAAARACLKTLQARGLGAGDELVIFTDNNRQFLVAFWGAVLGGIVPVPVAVGISDEHRVKLFRILDQLERPHLFSNAGLLARLQDFAEARGERGVQALLQKACIDAAELAGEGSGELYEPEPADLAFVQYSSGSTSDPKGVCLRHRNIVANLHAMVEAIDVDEHERSFSWMPLTHDMGLIGYHMVMFAADMDQALMDTAVFVRRPLLWLQKVSELRSTVLCSPNFGYKHYLKVAGRKGPGDIDLSSVRLLLNGAEPISVELCQEFMAAMAPYGLRSEAMLPVYGLAEATLAVTIPALGNEFSWISVDRHALRIGEPYREIPEDDPDAVRFVRCGKPIRYSELRITDDEDRPLADGAVGHIQIGGPNVTEGLYGNPEAASALYTADGWLRTGDCGAIADGELVITGRHKEIIIVNGQNYSPHDLEQAVAVSDELELGKVVVCGARKRGGLGEELLVFVLYRKDIESFVPLADRVRKIIGVQIGLEIDHVIPVTRIPKTTSGASSRRPTSTASSTPGWTNCTR